MRKVPKNAAAVALAKRRMQTISPERRLEISRQAAKAAAVVHHAKALARRAAREAAATEPEMAEA